jgi:hypothetical protein
LNTVRLAGPLLRARDAYTPLRSEEPLNHKITDAVVYAVTVNSFLGTDKGKSSVTEGRDGADHGRAHHRVHAFPGYLVGRNPGRCRWPHPQVVTTD